MEGDAGYHGFLCLGDFLVEDEVTDAVIDWHFVYGVYWLEDVGMMPDDGCYSCLGKSVGKGTLSNAGVGLKLYSPMHDDNDMRVGVLVMEIPDFIEQFILGWLCEARFVVNTAPVLYC